MLVGKAGELRVASELLLRGHRPCLNLIDTGCDLYLEGGISIQVKSSKLGKGKASKPWYHFSLRDWKKSGPHGLVKIDFLVLWGIDSDDFWIVPASLVSRITTLTIPPHGRETRSGNRRGEFFFNRDQFHDNWAQLLQKKEG